MTVSAIDELDDRAVVLAVQYLAEDLRRDEPTLVRTEAEARLVISALLAQTNVANTDPSDLLPTEPVALAAARRALVSASADSAAQEMTAELLADPPRDEQMSVETALASLSVFALLIAWLQTKVELQIHRKDNKTEVGFTLSKQAADGHVLRAIATAFGSILGIPTSGNPPTPGDDQQNPAQ